MANPLFEFTSGPYKASVMAIAESWGAEEARLRKPLVGASGQEFDRMLQEAGLSRNQIHCSNIISEQPPNNKMEVFFEGKKHSQLPPLWGLYPKPNIRNGLQLLLQQVETVNPRIIIAMGNYALWALTGKNNTTNADKALGSGLIPTGIESWRGSMLHTRPEFGSRPCLPIIHPAALFRNWSQRPLIVHDLKRVPMALNDHWDAPLRQKIATPTYEELHNFFFEEIKLFNHGPPQYRVVDIETKRRNIICIGIATSRDFAISIPLVALDNHRAFISWWPFDQEVVITRMFRAWITHPNNRLIGQNFLYDMQYLSRWYRLPTIKCFYDTMLGQHIFLPGTPKALDHLSSLYREWHVYWKGESQEWDEHGSVEQLLYYNCEDCISTYETWEEQSKVINNLGLQSQITYIHHAQDDAFDMMKRGININKEVRAKYSSRLTAEIDKVRRWLLSIIPQKVYLPTVKTKTLWVDSPHQQRTLFYEVLGLEVQFNRKTKRPSIDDEALNNLKLKYPILLQVWEAIAGRRSAGVFKETFLDAPLDPDGRMRCSLNPGGTETFRFSSSENAFYRGTNLQNIPEGDE